LPEIVVRSDFHSRDIVRHLWGLAQVFDALEGLLGEVGSDRFNRLVGFEVV
jgi:hypothetical protein